MVVIVVAVAVLRTGAARDPCRRLWRRCSCRSSYAATSSAVMEMTVGARLSILTDFLLCSVFIFFKKNLFLNTEGELKVRLVNKRLDIFCHVGCDMQTKFMEMLHLERVKAKGQLRLCGGRCCVNYYIQSPTEKDGCGCGSRGPGVHPIPGICLDLLAKHLDRRMRTCNLTC